MPVVWMGDVVFAKTAVKADKQLYLLALMVEREAKQGMKGARHGVKYPNLPNTSSAPGEPPAVQTGFLVRKITTEKIGRLAYKVGVNVPYGLYLELGTRHIRPRPWLRPALSRAKKLWKMHGLRFKG